MFDDIVIDTNVLMHASNVSSGRSAEALDLLKILLSAKTVLCVDIDLNIEVQVQDSSLILQEYKEVLDGMSLGALFISQLASDGRIKHVSRRVPADINKWISQRISNSRDRTFLKVTTKSDERVLVSHDFHDFNYPLRKDIHKHIDVSVMDAGEAITTGVDK